ncbi:MAG: DivIVA domain-containing protein [Oscillospiraceae bacterium]
MTPQDIREKTFEKAMFGGYDMAAVQNYQEEVATELANAQKEIAVLKGKMKVLVDKIEEYRASEDAMRLAILSAQKVGKQIEDDAQARADKILSEAKNTSDRILGGLQHETANEEAKLLNAKTSCAKFLEDVRNLCLTQLEYLDGVAGSKAASAPRGCAPDRERRNCRACARRAGRARERRAAGSSGRRAACAGRARVCSRNRVRRPRGGAARGS